MSTFLELCQSVAAESGTMTGGESSISTVVDVTGRAAKVVRWTQQAWLDIQRSRPSWKWMTAEFEAPLVIAQGSYSGADFSLTRVSKFLGDNRSRRISAYQTSKGVSDEGFLQVIPIVDYLPVYTIGTNRTETGRPKVASIGDDGRLNIWPKPDVAHTVHGWYRRSAQNLSADADVPEMPSEFHSAIVWKALLLMGQYDEATTQYPFWNAEFRRVMVELERDQLPMIEVPGTLA
jgi:hypothetical protein